MQVIVRPHTVFLVVSSSTTKCRDFPLQLAQALDRVMEKNNVQHGVSALLSLHAVSEDLIGMGHLGPQDLRIAEIHDQAKAILHAEFNGLVSFPVSKEFIVIDTNGNFRDAFDYAVFEKAKANGYEVVLINVGKDTIKAEYPPEYDYILTFDEDYDTELNIVIQDVVLYGKCHLYPGQNDTVTFVGDVHEDVRSFETMLETLRSWVLPPNAYNYIVQVGNYLDKGTQTKEILKSIKRFVEAGGRVLVGNHESYVYKRLTGAIASYDTVLEAKYFSSLSVLQEDEESRKLFIDLFENHTLPFIKVSGAGIKTIYGTHAPCENMHLGKISNAAQKAQRNLFTLRHLQDYRKSYQFVFDEACLYHPNHVFGHVVHGSQSINVQNKWFIDTGSAYGNVLTAVSFRGASTGRVLRIQSYLDKSPTVLPLNASENPQFEESPVQ